MDINQPVFLPHELDKNEQKKRELINLVSTGEAILMVGAGSSISVGYKSWSCLLNELVGHAKQYGDDFDPHDLTDLLELAEYIKMHIRKHTGNDKRYYKILHTLFNGQSLDRKSLEWHKELVSLPFRGIVTTNYDMVLENALIVGGAVNGEMSLDLKNDTHASSFMMSLLNPVDKVSRIAHLHGVFSDPSNIVLSMSDYVEAYGLRLSSQNADDSSIWTLRRKILWSILSTRRMVFVGFSLTDPYFIRILEAVADDLWFWDESIHYAVMGITASNKDESFQNAARLKRDYGVDVVFYEVVNDSHRELENLVLSISHACSHGSPQSSVVTENAIPTPQQEENQDIEAHAGSLSQVSSRMKERKRNENQP